MRRNCLLILLLGGMTVVCSSCFSNKKLAANYYYENEAALNDIEQSYRKLYKYKPFSVEFTDRDLDYVSITFITEKLKYIYEFGFNEPRLADSIRRFQMDTATVLPLLRKMREIHCVWVNNLDYYVDGQKKNMTFLSMKPILWKLPFTDKKYYILTFFNQPQYFDGEGRLLANRKQRRLRRINDDVFKRINDKVCYALSERFR